MQVLGSAFYLFQSYSTNQGQYRNFFYSEKLQQLLDQLSPPWFFPAGCLLVHPFCLGDWLFCENLVLKNIFTGL